MNRQRDGEEIPLYQTPYMCMLAYDDRSDEYGCSGPILTLEKYTERLKGRNMLVQKVNQSV